MLNFLLFAIGFIGTMNMFFGALVIWLGGLSVRPDIHSNMSDEEIREIARKGHVPHPEEKAVVIGFVMLAMSILVKLLLQLTPLRD
ncbi:hypothetical protein [Thalassoroseus pseudoceratinae]|uniref:hypothetical protein n=1 Tax=Thalassoroseus pseudoceratinae TaxID=2713176 RepID=UPI001420BE63|nr:hypothetical protein [Thalassoroseus pseudoceratinae]